jgi:LDH2 family malate/lactate/ureidoglycolate dehydrogenase
VNIPAERVREQVAAILAAWGMDADLAQTTVGAMVYADLAGIDSHGFSLLTTYEDYWTKGKVNFKARPRIVRENPVTALVDAGSGLGYPAAVAGMELAIRKALAMGVGVVSVYNSHHFGAAGYYAALAPRQGLIGMVTCTTRAINVVPTRGAISALGTNPIAFAAPGRRHRPFLLDMATSTVAGNKVRVYDLKGRPLPPGWVVDEKGASISDAALALDYMRNRDVGGITALGGIAETGGHKGYGLSMMVQILASTLGGGSFSPTRRRTQKGSDPDNIGQFFMAIDPRAFRPAGAFEDDLDALVDELHETRPADPAAPVLVAGDPEALELEKRSREGIPVPQTLIDKMRGVCERCGAPFVLA